MNVLGVVCPRSGEFFAIEANHVCSETFQVLLDEPVQPVTPTTERNVLILDNGSWHKRKALTWHGFEPLRLPPCCPDLNPIKRLRLIVKDRWLNNHVSEDLEELIERLKGAILELIGRPEELKKTTSFGKLL